MTRILSSYPFDDVTDHIWLKSPLRPKPALLEEAEFCLPANQFDAVSPPFDALTIKQVVSALHNPSVPQTPYSYACGIVVVLIPREPPALSPSPPVVLAYASLQVPAQLSSPPCLVPVTSQRCQPSMDQGWVTAVQVLS